MTILRRKQLKRGFGYLILFFSTVIMLSLPISSAILAEEGELYTISIDETPNSVSDVKYMKIHDKYEGEGSTRFNELQNNKQSIEQSNTQSNEQGHEQDNGYHDYLLLGNRGTLEWKYETAEGSYISTPALVDLDLDGDLEVVFITDADAVYALSNTGKYIWKNSNYTISRADEFMSTTQFYLHPIFSSITPKDITGDDKPELIFGADGQVVCLDAIGKEVWSAGDPNGDYISTPAVTDLDGENITKTDLEIVVIKDTDYTELRPQAFNSAGTTVFTLERPNTWNDLGMASVATMDLDGSITPDARKDLIFGNRYSPMRLYSCNETGYHAIISTSTWVTCMTFGTGAIGDFIGDSEYEYFIGTYDANFGLNDPLNARGVYSLYDPINATAALETDYRIWRMDTFGTGTGFIGSPAVGDVHGGNPNPTSGKVGFEGFLGSYNNRLYCIDLNTGNIVWSFNTGGRIYNAPALCDIGSDNSLEVIIASSNGMIYCLDGDPIDNIDEGITDSGGTNYDIIWQYDTGGSGSWVSSPVVADIDNDKELEVIVGDRDGTVWCLTAGSTGIVGQMDWPMFQHDAENTGVLPLRTKTFSQSLELVNGDGYDRDTCFAQYKPYTFRVTVEDGMGYLDLDQVILSFDPLNRNVQFKWSSSTNSFSELNNPDNSIELLTSESTSITDNKQNWTLEFKVLFNWNFIPEKPVGCSIQSTGKINPTKSKYFPDFINIVNKLDFKGNLEVISESQGLLEEGDWVKGGEKVYWTNLSVVYEKTLDFYPPVDKYSIQLKDEGKNIWKYTPKSQGEIFNFTSSMPLINDTDRMFYLNITTIPQVDNVDDVSNQFKLRVDNDAPGPPHEVIIHADSYTDANTIADNDTRVYVTFTSPTQDSSGIKGYYYSTSDNSGTKNGTYTTKNQFQITVYNNGIFNVYVWAIDNVGNIGAASNGLIFIDKEEVKYSDYYPKTLTWFSSDSILTGVMISDSNGIGVDIDSIQYSILSPSKPYFGPWLSINQNTDLNFTHKRRINVNTKITFSESGINYLRWRARDLAGNGYTISEESSILIDDLPVHFSGPTDVVPGVGDLRWRKCNITIIDGGGSGINTTSIQYKYSTNGTDEYTDWINTDLKVNDATINIDITLLFKYGKNNYIRWRANDVAGNGYVESDEIQIFINSPPVIGIISPLNNSKLYVEDILKFDASGSYDPDDADVLSYYWISSFTSDLGQKAIEILGTSVKFENDLKKGGNDITLYVSDGNYNISENIYVLVYDQFTDIDKDGMPDWWEEQYVGLDPNYPGDARADLDGDGVDNIDEYLGETNPADPNDYPGKKITSTSDDDNFSTLLLIYLIVLIIVVILLVSLFFVKRSRIKKARFKELRESSPAVLFRRDTLPPELQRDRTKSTAMQQPSTTPQISGVGFGPVGTPKHEPLPQLPPHLAGEVSTQPSQPEAQPQVQQPQVQQPPSSAPTPPPESSPPESTSSSTSTSSPPQTSTPPPEQPVSAPSSKPPVGTTPQKNSNSTTQGGDN